MGDTARIDLSGPLARHHVIIDRNRALVAVNQVTDALAELRRGKIRPIVEAMASMLVGGDLPRGQDVEGLLSLHPSEFSAFVSDFTGWLKRDALHQKPHGKKSKWFGRFGR